MRIGITIDESVISTGTGVACYIRSLLRSLFELDQSNEYILIYTRTKYPPVLPVEPNRRIRYCEIPVNRALLHRGPWFFLNWPLVERFTGPLDVIHHTGVATHVPTRLPLVVTVYDLFPEMYPHHFNPRGRLWRFRLVEQMRNQARYLLSVSEATKNDVIRLLAVPAERVIHTPLALPLDFAATLDKVNASVILSKMGITEPHFLFVGRIDPRKNLTNLLYAFERFIHETSYPHRLIVAGSLGTGSRKILRQARALNGRVIFLGYQPLSHVVALMKNACAFVYPPLYEGFGFPLLEAMACGTPIAASNVSSIPEVAGPAANYFNPYDSADICRALVELVEDASLRATLIEEGHRRLADFSWERTARQTLEVYYRVAGEQ
jgi:glycosyltransferase involved in cell wall biosynthesis